MKKKNLGIGGLGHMIMIIKDKKLSMNLLKDVEKKNHFQLGYTLYKMLKPIKESDKPHKLFIINHIYEHSLYSEMFIINHYVNKNGRI